MTLCRRTAALACLLLLVAALSVAQPGSTSRIATGIFRGHRVTYQIVNGRMIFEGDIALEHVDQKLSEVGAPSATLDYQQYLWPKVGSVYQIPYTIDAQSADAENINAAVSQYNNIFKGLIQWVPQTTEADYVDFSLTASDSSGVGNSYIGRVGGNQLIWGAGNCTVPTLLHEMGHATGLWHEQSRPDRNSYVTVNYSNMISVEQSNSDQQFDDMQALTPYDWGSLMHYNAWSFTKNGAPTLESIPPGMVLSNNVGYSSSDIDGIKRLYGATPASVTVTTNPPGLQVLVDGKKVNTPHTFNWALGSAHILAVSANAQSLAGIAYTFGRWNDNGDLSHTVTVLPGNGELGFPATRPAVTVYTANFIQLVPYTMTISPANTGSVAASPSPQAYPGVSGLYYVVRQQVTLTATPNAGQNFYEYINSPYWLRGGLSTNPKTFYAMDDGTSINTTAYFSPTLVYTVTSTPADSNFYVNVDGSYWPAPKSFSSFYDSTWTNGSNHSISVDATQWPYTLNSRYLFGSWSDGGDQTHNITLSTDTTLYTATLMPQYYLSDYANEGCAGAVGVVPVSPTNDDFYPSGTLLQFSQTPNPGWTFTEWQHDLSGSSSPQTLNMNDELLVVADYNTTTTPLTVASIRPSAAIAGGSGFTMAINGTGFTSGTVVFVNNTFRTSTLVNSNQLTVPITAADLKTPGGYQIFVENFPSGAPCAAFAALPFNVAHSPLVKPSVLSVAFGAQPLNVASAVKTVTFLNTGTSPVIINGAAASGNFTIATNTCGTTLAAKASCSVGITFAPQAAGTISGSFAVSDSAPDSPQVVALSGSGTLPLSISPVALSFGTVSVGQTSAAKTVTLTNNESSTLNFSLAASGNYAIGSGTTCGGSLASKAKCTLAVTFTPTANGAANGAAAITDATSFSPQLVALSGSGAGGSASPLTFAPSNLTFASQGVGTTSAAKIVTVKNVSGAAVTLSSIAATGDFSAVGGATKPCAAGLQLNSGASCTLSVAFSPAPGTTGNVSGGIVVTDNTPVSQQILGVKGTAVLPLSFSPTSLSFSPQTVARASAPQAITVTNNLTGVVNLTITGNGEFSATPGGATPCGSSLAGQAQCTLTVTFTPSGVGSRAGAVTVTDSANPGVQTVSVSGTGQ